jgi:DNA-binding winged helix-turn-helix (wHTH) protein
MRLQDKPLQILTLLMEHPGEVVTREELQKRLWTDGIIVDFEHSINTAVKRLREALGDDAEHPRFIETLPRHGYRFIAPVDRGAMQELPLPTSGPRAIHQSPLRRHWAVAVAGGLVVAVVAMLFTLNIASLRDRMVTLVQARHVVPPPKIEAIAVLPFENLSHDPEQEYFADGMTDELITNLGKISGLSVISRT